MWITVEFLYLKNLLIKEIGYHAFICTMKAQTLLSVYIKTKINMEEKPKYLVRPDDYFIFEVDETNGCYRSKSSNLTYSDGTKVPAQKHFTYENLTLNYGFFPIDEDELDVYQKKEEMHINFEIWQSRSDGHGGSKGGTWEEFREKVLKIAPERKNKESLDFYKNLNYDIIVEKYSEDGDEETLYCAYTREFGYYSCYGVGKSQDKAVKSFLKEKGFFLEMLYKENNEIPLPKSFNKLKRDIKQHIICAAIWYNDGKERPYLPINITTGVVVSGWRHGNCIGNLLEMFPNKDYITNNKDGKTTIQGFLTSDGKFVDREEAAQIAFDAGQIVKETKGLSSENLY